jgi:putative sterol carrier protein
MVTINEPQDILGIAIHNLLDYREKLGELEALVANWEKTVIIDVIGTYPVSVHFQGKDVRIEPGSAAKFDLEVSMSLETMIALAKGETGSLHAFMLGQVKVKKMWHVGTLLTFLKIIIPSLKIAGERGAHFGKTHRS